MSVPPSQPRANVGSILRVLGTPKANLLCFHLGKKLLQQTPFASICKRYCNTMSARCRYFMSTGSMVRKIKRYTVIYIFLSIITISLGKGTGLQQ